MFKRVAAASAVVGWLVLFPVMADAAFSKGDGTPGNPYIIRTVEQLQEMQSCLTCSYKLGNDIDASVTRTWDSGKGFKPVGYYTGDAATSWFKGSFDGDGYKISYLYSDRRGELRGGLFGSLHTGTTIQNLYLDAIEIVGDSFTGGLAGIGLQPVIQGVFVSGSINASAGNSVGGLVGYIDGGRMSDVAMSGTVRGSQSVGGITGTGTNTIIEKASSYGEVRGTIKWIAGIVGVIDGYYGPGIIEKSYSEARIYGGSEVGGVAGMVYQSGLVRDSYARGPVSGGDRVGGLVANTNTSGAITRSYSTGLVTGSTNLGGLNGRTTNGTLITNSYYDREASGKTDTGRGVPKTTAEMKIQATYAGWDFGSVWGISPLVNNGYPYMKDVVRYSAPSQAVPGLRVAGHTTNSIALAWEAQIGLRSYVLKRNGQQVYNGTVRSFQDSGLAGGTDYAYELIGRNEAGDSVPVTLTQRTDIVRSWSVDAEKERIEMTPVSITGNIETSRGELGKLTVIHSGDNTTGWSLHLSASPLTPAMPHQLILAGTGEVNRISGDVTEPFVAAGSLPLGTAPVQLLHAPAGSGSGVYEVGFPPGALELSVDTSLPLLNPGETSKAYQSTITYQISVGP